MKSLEQEIADSGGDRAVLVRNHVKMRQLAKEAGLRLPGQYNGTAENATGKLPL